MADREQTLNGGAVIGADTSAGQVIYQSKGRFHVDIQGTFGGGTLAYHSFSPSQGRGAEIRTAATVIEAFESHAQGMEFVLTGSTSPALFVLVTPIVG